MEFLKTAVFMAALVATPAAQAGHSQDGEPFDPREKIIAEQAQHLCNSTDEYIRTLTFLRATKDILIPENTARMVAEKVSRGCDGAADRFEKILTQMKTTGLSDPKSLEIALKFSSYSPEVQRGFSEIFNRAFLAEFFDFDYQLAVALALELSKDYKGEPAHVRDDFIYLAQLCKDGKSMDLPAKTCAEYAIKVAKLSQLYPHGIRQQFTSFYKVLREDRDFGMDIKKALEVTYSVLKNGPKAADNFMSGYAFAMKEKGLGLTRSQALDFALRMANRSFIGEKPPAIPALTSITNASTD